MLRLCALFFFLGIMPAVCGAQVGNIPKTHNRSNPVFRAPFLLKLQIDNQRRYEEKFKQIPYVIDNGVYLFSGESFGVNFVINGNKIADVVYQPDISRADVTFQFKQEQSQNGRFGMILVTHNNLKRRMQFDALMTVPGSKEIHQTSVMPVRAGLSTFESWPHPIVQLLLHNFRFSADNSQQVGH